MACATRRSRTTGHPLCGSAVRAEGHRPVDRRLPHVETSCRAGGGRTLRAVRPDADRRAGGPGAGSRRHLSAATGRRRYAGDLQCLRHLRHAHAGTGNVRHGGGGGAGLRQAGCCQRSWRPARDRSGIRWSAFPNRRLCGLGRPPGSAPGQPRFAGHAGSGRARKCRAVRLASYRPTLPGGLRRTMSTPLVSIAMPFYNAERTIGASIRSMLLQTYPNWELLLCDDGSTDASRELARAFHDPRIVVCGDQRRLQLGARLNECIERARGEYVARMDADDIAYPRRLEKQLRFLADHPEVDLTGGWAVLFADAGAPVGKAADPAAHVLVQALPLARRRHPLRRPRSAVSCLRGQPVCQPAGDRARLPAGLHRFAEVLALTLDVVPLCGALSEWRRASAGGRGGSIEELPRRFSGGGAGGCRLAARALRGAQRGGIAGMAAGMGLGIVNAASTGAVVWPVPDYDTVADSVRDLFRSLGLDAANPLGRWIRPGMTVVVKPNWVKHEFGDTEGRNVLFTHASLVRVLIDAALKALAGDGRVYVADAPLQGCDFARFRRQSGLAEMEKDYARAPVAFLDLRQQWAEIDDASSYVRWVHPLAGDPHGYSLVDLGARSRLVCFGVNAHFGVTDYSSENTTGHHRGAHRYAVGNTVLSADVILNVPKLKTHMKTGMTGALKNFVGIVGSKDFLPHFRAGSPSAGGDEYPDKNWISHAASPVRELLQ